ncbi:MAG: hypothetical protein AAF380_01790, partial [Bacteroidota bacterium]
SIDQLPQNSEEPIKIGNGLINQINEKQNAIDILDNQLVQANHEIDKLQDEVHSLQAPNPSLEPEEAQVYQRLLSDYKELKATKESDKKDFQNQINQLQKEKEALKTQQKNTPDISTKPSTTQGFSSLQLGTTAGVTAIVASITVYSLTSTTQPKIPHKKNRHSVKKV